MFTRPSLPEPSIAQAPQSRSSPAESDSLLSKPFVLMLCVQFCFGLAYSTFFLLPKYLTREFHAGASAIGAVTAVGLLAGVLATPWIGAVIDRGSRRAAALCGALLNAVCAWLFIYVHSVSLPLYLLRAGLGISYALVFSALVTVAADLAPAKKLSQAIGLCGAAGMLSNAIAPAIAERVADHQGWGLAFLLASGAALFAALLSLGIGDRRADAATTETTTRTTAQTTTQASADAKATTEVTAVARDDAPSAWTFVRDPARAGAFVCSAASGAGFGVMFTFTQPFALAHGANHVSNFFIGYTISALAVRVFLGSLADRVGRHRVAFGALVLYGLVACMTSQLRPGLLFPFGVGLGVAHGLLYPAINAIGAEGVPRARRGAVISYFAGCFYGGFALWVFAAGVLAKSTGYPVVFLLSALLIWSSLACLPRKAKELRA